MKTLKTFTELKYVIDNRLDVKHFQGHNISFVKLLQMPLIDIICMMNDGLLSYPVFM